MPTPLELSNDVHQLSAAFWQHIKNGSMEVSYMNALRTLELTLPVDAFSVDLPEEAVEGEKYRYQ